ncbi:MAG: hypothetical protein K2W95_19655 [Candidatus Obscuribacterales bacterium]|nr:hypothetical protein [Candidatus Obscuribacterales bacterium]
MDKRKAAFIVTAVGAILAGAVAPLASFAECYIYKFTSQPVLVESQPVAVRRFVDRVQPTITIERPVLVERTLSAPVLLEDSCAPAPVLMDQCAPATRVISKPVLLENRSTFAPRLVGSSRFVNRTVVSSVLTGSGTRAEMLQQLRTLGLPILIDSSDLNDWDTVKIKRKKFGGVRQTVLEVKD